MIRPLLLFLCDNVAWLITFLMAAAVKLTDEKK